MEPRRRIPILLVTALLIAPAGAQSLIQQFVGAPGDQLGATVGALGDLDHDGWNEVIVGSPHVGKAVVYNGRTWAVMHTVTGPASDRFAAVVGSAGDFDGNGTSDFFVSSPDYSSPLGQPFVGRVQIWSGSTGVPLATIQFGVSNSHFGTSVLSIGDVDGDGRSEIVVGAANYFNNRGTLRAYRGGTATQYWGFDNATNDQFLGTSLASLGDVDGDGRTDFVVGASGTLTFPSAPGFFRVYSSATLTELGTEYAASLQTGFGSFVAGIGDLDGDGRSEILAGSAPLNGTLLPEARIYRFAGFDLLHVLPGRIGGAGAVGDLDGDARSEFIVASPTANGSGSLGLYSGASFLPLRSWQGTAAESLGAAAAVIHGVSGPAPLAIVGAPFSSAGGTASGAARIINLGTYPGSGRDFVLGTAVNQPGATPVTSARDVFDLGDTDALTLRFFSPAGTAAQDPLYIAVMPFATGAYPGPTAGFPSIALNLAPQNPVVLLSGTAGTPLGATTLSTSGFTLSAQGWCDLGDTSYLVQAAVTDPSLPGGFATTNAVELRAADCPVYVSASSGSDANAGDRGTPVATIARALQIVQSFGVLPSGRHRPIRIASGDYTVGATTISIPVDMQGSLNATTWLPESTVTTTWHVPSSGARFHGITGSSTVKRIRFIAAPGADGGTFLSVPAESSIAVRVTSCPNGPRFEGCEFRAANGGNGQTGFTGSAGAPGAAGSSGIAGSFCHGNAFCRAAGGVHGSGGTAAQDGGDGGTGGFWAENGSSGTSAPAGACGGAGGQYVTCDNGYFGTSGCWGSTGAHGGMGGAALLGYATAIGFDVGVPGTAGSHGSNGTAGGGGGGGSGGAGGCFVGAHGGGGGGGGAAGIGGSPGSGGGNGGASFAVFIWGALPTFDGCLFAAAQGGSGGTGGSGGAGGAGGVGGIGGDGDIFTVPPFNAVVAGGPGGSGGSGGSGGAGGAGQGGHGGPSFCVYRALGAFPVLTNPTYVTGMGGTGGLGGLSAGVRAGFGQTGATGTVY